MTIFTPALPGTEVVIFPKVFKVRSLLDVAPTTSAVTCHQRQPISEATKTAPQVNFLQLSTREESADFADKIPTTSFAVGTFKYNLVSPSGSVLKPAGGHFGDGEGDTLLLLFFFFFFFLTGGFLTGAFFTGAFLVTLAFGVGVGLFVAAVAGATDKASPKANASANFLDLITSVGPT